MLVTHETPEPPREPLLLALDKAVRDSAEHCVKAAAPGLSDHLRATLVINIVRRATANFKESPAYACAKPRGT